MAARRTSAPEPDEPDQPPPEVEVSPVTTVTDITGEAAERPEVEPVRMKAPSGALVTVHPDAVDEMATLYGYTQA